MEFSMHESVIVKHQSSSSASLTSIDEPEPVSRTYQYRKVMKPLLERKRRARINKCLDDLKDLMVEALQSEGENVSKLEKADILELTVTHLQKLRRQQRLVNSSPVIESDRFRAGFTHAANEVSRCLATTRGVNVSLGRNLMTHLGHRLNELDVPQPQPLCLQIDSAARQQLSAMSPVSSLSSTSSECDADEVQMSFAMPLTPASSDRSCDSTPSPTPMEMVAASENVWRPW